MTPRSPIRDAGPSSDVGDSIAQRDGALRCLISAPCVAPRFEGQQLLAAARRSGVRAWLFDSDASRDPTLELPVVTSRLRPDVVLLVAPRREDPATLRLLRGYGATVVAWLAPLARSFPRHLRARPPWIAGESCRLAVTHEWLGDGLLDRLGRSPRVVPPGFDAETLGGIATDTEAPETGRVVALRGGDDPLFVSPSPEDESSTLVGYGVRAAFGAVRFGGELTEPREFAAVVSRSTFVIGGRLELAAPGVFDAGAAAAAAGARVVRVAYGADLASAEPCEPRSWSFEECLAVLLRD